MVSQVLLLILFGYYFYKKKNRKKKTTIFTCDQKNTKRTMKRTVAFLNHILEKNLGKINYNKNFIAINSKLKINGIVSIG
jgi:hypothetical protein